MTTPFEDRTPARKEAEDQLSALDRIAVYSQYAVLAAHFALVGLGVVGIVWGYFAGSFLRLFFGVVGLFLALFAPRFTSVSLDLVEGRIRARMRKF